MQYVQPSLNKIIKRHTNNFRKYEDKPNNFRDQVLTQILRKNNDDNPDYPRSARDVTRRNIDMIIPQPSTSTDPTPAVNTVSPQLAAEMLQDVLKEFKDVFDNTVVGCINDYEYEVKLRSDTVAPVIHASRKVPFALRDAVEKELQRMLQLQVIAKVDEPSEWVNSMVIVERPEKMRICLDPSSLNKCVMREHTYLPTVDEVLSQISLINAMKIYAILCNFFKFTFCNVTFFTYNKYFA